MKDETEVDEERTTQLSFLALLSFLRRRRVRPRELFRCFDRDDLSYPEVAEELGNNDELREMLSAHDIAMLVGSMFPTPDALISEAEFTATLRMMRSIHFPSGSFSEWAGLKLLTTQKHHIEACERLESQGERMHFLESSLNALRLTEQELEETKKSLKDARANLSRIIREKTELSRENSAITVSKETIGDDKEELESQLNLTSVSLAASEEGLRVTRGQLAETVENLHRVQEINTR